MRVSSSRAHGRDVTGQQPLSACLQELTAELGEREASSDDEATVTTRVVRRRVIIQVPAAERMHVGTVSPSPGGRPRAVALHAAVWPQEAAV